MYIESYDLFCISVLGKADREGGRPLELIVQKSDINGFTAKQEWGISNFIAPCVFYAHPPLQVDQGNGAASSPGTKKVFY